MYSLEEFDEAKTKVLKYIVYKKRTENEVRQKFQNVIEDDMLEDVIDYLKDAKYLDDRDYINRAVNNFMALKNLSIKELKYKLMAKGLNKDLLDDYFYENKEDLILYEIKSAMNVIEKKKREMEEFEIKNYLIKKGYKLENIKVAFEQ